jgi:hypothetical protein
MPSSLESITDHPIRRSAVHGAANEAKLEGSKHLLIQSQFRSSQTESTDISVIGRTDTGMSERRKRPIRKRTEKSWWSYSVC